MWLAVILINLGYGASFAIQPRLLADLYGKRKVSKTHPLLLTAWAAAGLFGSQIGDQIYISGGGPSSLMIVLGLIYIIGFGLSLIFKWIYKVESKEKENG
jgi:OFA family oxalate/formate antiporter-like MFS transporter